REIAVVGGPIPLTLSDDAAQVVVFAAAHRTRPRRQDFAAAGIVCMGFALEISQQGAPEPSGTIPGALHHLSVGINLTRDLAASIDLVRSDSDRGSLRRGERFERTAAPVCPGQHFPPRQRRRGEAAARVERTLRRCPVGGGLLPRAA